MPAEMECEGQRLIESAKVSDFKKSPVIASKSYSIKKNMAEHEQPYRSSGSAIEDLFSKKKGKMSPNLKGKDVLNRLDSLVAGDKQEVTLECKGILKQKSTQLNSRRKKRHIRFPDSKKIQEIIGWDGGEEYNGTSSSASGESSDEEDQKNIVSKSIRNEELTTEERNVINITRRNTSYNAHAPNLLKDNPKSNLELSPPSHGLGMGKTKTPPLVIVSPFASKQSPEKVNKVQSIIRDKIVQSGEKQEKKIGALKSQTNMVAQTPINKAEMVRDKLNSDGGSNDSSSPSSSSDGESSGSMSPRSETIGSSLLSSSTAIKIDVSSSNTQSKTNIEISGKEEISQIDSPAKSSPLSRKSFLSSTLSSSATATKLTLPVDIENKSDDINSIKVSTTSSLSTISSTFSQTNAVLTDSKCEEYTSVYVNNGGSFKGSKEAESLVDESRKTVRPQLNRSKTSSVKLTRSSPYTLSSSSSTSILKGTPKPSVVVRKPPVSKDKPKIPVKPTKLLNPKLSLASQGKSLSEIHQQKKMVDRKTSIKIEGNSLSCVSNLKDNEMQTKCIGAIEKEVEISEVTISKGLDIDLITVNGKPTSIMAECYSADCDVQNALVIDVKASNDDGTDSKVSGNEIISTSKLKCTSAEIDENAKSENHDVVVTSNTSLSSKLEHGNILIEKSAQAQSKNREELLKAIRESLSDKLLSTEQKHEEKKQMDSNNANTNQEKFLSNDSIKLEVSDSETKKRDQKDETSGLISTNKSCTVNPSFQATRATIASALGGKVNYNKQSSRQSFAKRQAPKTPAPQPPDISNDGIEKEESQAKSYKNNDSSQMKENGAPSSDDYDNVDDHNDSVELNTEQSSCILTALTKDLPPEPIVSRDGIRERSYNPKKPLSPPPPISFKQSHPPPPKSALVAAARHSSMKSEMSPNRSAIKKGVQFNPETTMMKLPDSMDLHVTNHHNLIKCNRWLKDGSSPINPVPKVVESSFTGQPIQVNNSHPAPPSQTTAMSSTRQKNLSSSQTNHLAQRPSPHNNKADQHSHLLSPVVTYAQNAPSKVCLYS